MDMGASSLDDIKISGEKQDNIPWVKWSSSLELGIPRIDSQHKHLVSMCNDLHEALVQSRATDKVGWRVAIATAMRQTVEYARTHFADEEKLMHACNYKDFDAHKQQHREFIQTVTKVLVNFDDMTLPLAFDFADYLRDWVLGHVDCDDKQYSPVVKAFYQNLKMQQQNQSDQ